METGKTRPSKGTLLTLMAKHFNAHPGSIVSLDDLRDATGGNGQTIQAYVNKLRRLMPTIEVINIGHLWRYMPSKAAPEVKSQHTVLVPTDTKAKRRLFEEIGAAKDGSLILEAETGTLYRATEL